MTSSHLFTVIAVSMAAASQLTAAQPPRRPGGPGGGTDYTMPGLTVAPARGASGSAIDGNLVYGPFEAGFSSTQTSQFFGCTNSLTLPAGVDTLEAEKMVHAQASLGFCDEGISILEECGGHANPYHYHERMTCLYTTDEPSGHSTTTATMLDGKMLYGKWEDAHAEEEPVLDACNGHFGVTPDSDGEVVYHYHITSLAPFTAGCFGPAVDPDTAAEQMVTIQQCRDFHPTCGDGDETSITTADDAGAVVVIQYDPDCPCFDGEHSNIGSVPLPFESGIVTTTAVPVSTTEEAADTTTEEAAVTTTEEAAVTTTEEAAVTTAEEAADTTTEEAAVTTAEEAADTTTEEAGEPETTARPARPERPQRPQRPQRPRPPAQGRGGMNRPRRFITRGRDVA